jgi:hypothetical protein
MEEVGKVIIIFGFILVLVGVLFLLFGKLSPLGGLPGDIMIKKEDFSFYAPITTSLLVSLIIPLVLFLISNLRK